MAILQLWAVYLRNTNKAEGHPLAPDPFATDTLRFHGVYEHLRKATFEGKAKRNFGSEPSFGDGVGSDTSRANDDEVIDRVEAGSADAASAPSEFRCTTRQV